MPYFSHKLLGVILGLLISGQVLSVAAVELNPAHPESYEVVKGDTLWDISARFLHEPWLWPDVWYVNPQIANPHLIYPGDRIVLTYKDGRPILSLQRGSQHLKLSPAVLRWFIDYSSQVTTRQKVCHVTGWTTASGPSVIRKTLEKAGINALTRYPTPAVTASSMI
ncbi:LysM peptidoglycan-binding domain-containing protein [endosymbiont of Lamellibrachia barhami]|uniref:LysM peptidoglycan-binding domain-containing protein n=1 Tax=endosymbiont of Lamellibrachia barhami TaxID=205975 RepID=UPI0015AE6353|nr:LysM peptidoglycan-binding domain-containing protein [endosymbiont of Lamellibrachia barhami]